MKASRLSIRPATTADVEAGGRICYQAFTSIAQRHNFPLDFSSVDVATEMVSGLIAHPGFYSVIAESDGTVVGANFLDERSTIFSIGPIVVDPQVMDRGIGRTLMLDVLDRSAQSKPPGVRLVQVAYHNRSLGLYTEIGFQTREAFAAMNGQPVKSQQDGYPVRPATADDADACSAVCRLVHGHDRRGEFDDAVAHGSAMLVERGGRVTGYTTGINFFAHSVAETDDDMIALIAAADQFGPGAGFLVPLRNTRLMQWCLRRGLRITYMANLMSVGLYQEPRGAFLASVGY